MTSFRYKSNPAADSCKQLIRDAIASLQSELHRKQLLVNIDSNDLLPPGIGCSSFVRLVETLVARAIDRSPVRGAIDITICLNAAGLEIEIADAGENSTDSHCTPAFARGKQDHNLMVAMSSNIASGFMVWVCRCPQGGTAVTVRLPLARALAVAA